MKKLILSAFTLFSLGIFAQSYQFKNVIDIESTPVISQDKTGTCWSYATTSFLESEIIRMTGKQIDLSEMYNVRNTYMEKAENYVMRQGKAQFSQGALGHDVINSVAKHGIVPIEVFQGKEESEEKHDHTEMEAALKGMLDAFVKTKKLSPRWKQAVSSVLDIYMEKNPSEFTFEGKKYTPKSFLNYTKINPKDYISLTSFTHQPFYSNFILNISDNFSNGSFYNVPINELIENIDNALAQGFTVALDCDVSEIGFSAKEGIAVIPEEEDKEKTFLKEIKPEAKITQEFRQQEFENFNTTDDHLMHIVGKVKDQKGNIYYTVKNSWGSSGERIGNNGYIYMSVPYTKLKTISIMLHKDGLLAKTKKSLNL
ncbi:MAG: C1 family peptidase [Flavobacteriaceae bacterium]